MLYFIIGFVLLIIIGLVYTKIYQNKIKKEGIETTGVVRTSTHETWTNDGFLDKDTFYYVKYKDKDGKEIEAVIGNAKTSLQDGDKIVIKYLPKKPKYAYFVRKDDSK